MFIQRHFLILTQTMFQKYNTCNSNKCKCASIFQKTNNTVLLLQEWLPDGALSGVCVKIIQEWMYKKQ